MNASVVALPPTDDGTRPLSTDHFVNRLRREAERRYHAHHPFHRRMHEGRLSREELRRWVANRYYYQTRIPIKDALILAKSEDPAFRRVWLKRITDHDGVGEEDGGLALWRRLADAAGVEREELESLRSVLAGVRFACDGYVHLVRQASLVEAVASSLTEFFAPDLMAARIEAFERHYGFIDRSGLDYFRSRLPKSRRDADFALAFVVERATSRAEQEACVAALVRKTEILWEMLNCIESPPLPAGGA